MNTFIYERTPFDILVRNFFQDASKFTPLAETKVPHPVDIYTNEKGLFFEVACTGISKEDLKIETQDQTLRINYDKDKDASCCEVNDCDYIHRGIAKRHFTRSFTVADDVEVKGAEMVDGMLKIALEKIVPEGKKPRTIDIA